MLHSYTANDHSALPVWKAVIGAKQRVSKYRNKRSSLRRARNAEVVWDSEVRLPRMQSHVNTPPAPFGTSGRSGVELDLQYAFPAVR